MTEKRQKNLTDPKVYYEERLEQFRRLTGGLSLAELQALVPGRVRASTRLYEALVAIYEHLESGYIDCEHKLEALAKAALGAAEGRRG